MRGGLLWIVGKVPLYLKGDTVRKRTLLSVDVISGMCSHLVTRLVKTMVFWSRGQSQERQNQNQPRPRPYSLVVALDLNEE